MRSPPPRSGRAGHRRDARRRSRRRLGLSPLTALATEFGLPPLARSLLLLIAGPSLWGELARLYGILGNDAARSLVDEMLLVQIDLPALSTVRRRRGWPGHHPVRRGRLLFAKRIEVRTSVDRYANLEVNYLLQ